MFLIILVLKRVNPSFMGRKNFFRNRKKVFRYRKASLVSWYNKIFFKNSFKLYMPNFTKFFIFSNKNNLNKFIVFMYVGVYLFKFSIITKNRSLLSVDPVLNLIFFFNIPYQYFSKLFHKLFLRIYFSFFRVFFFKIKFKGKGYYSFKNYRNTLTTRFGISHRIYVYCFNLRVVFFSKTSFTFFGLDFCDMKMAAYAFYFSKPFNIFTGRGVRFSKHKLFKKSGKISTY